MRTAFVNKRRSAADAMRAGIAAAVLAFAALAFALALPFSSAYADDLDEIVNYRITVDVNEDATLSMVYHIDWKVLDSTSEGPLSWVRVGIPNDHYSSIEGLSDTIDSIRYDSSDGSYVRIDLDRNYYEGEIASFDFAIEQGTSYFTFNIPNSECTNEHCHYIVKQPLEKCPKCGAPMRQWTRVIGFLRPVENFDKYRHIEALTRYYAKEVK